MGYKRVVVKTGGSSSTGGILGLGAYILYKFGVEMTARRCAHDGCNKKLTKTDKVHW
jgi:hypothetical protein